MTDQPAKGTPRTDEKESELIASFYSKQLGHEQGFSDMADFARTLERELAAKTAECEGLKNAYDKRESAERQRADSLAGQLAEAQSRIPGYESEADRLSLELSTLRKRLAGAYEECARVCRKIAELYPRKDIGWDAGYAAGASRCALEITILPAAKGEQKDRLEAICPSSQCPMCSGEACLQCGAGCWSNVTDCGHDVIDRHKKAGTAPKGASDSTK